ncbi:MAG: DUF1178 family protein [Gammaproteobacteria bacterium]|nr:DUF1178 family protein [Gammaproteobacteria bacterium]MBU1440950.1 DUF1178 family protein [Gammaproteobacteria bacterium]MBU2289154.1 DUF1178 family protein [Gammaproteobacteria bacterium]
MKVLNLQCAHGHGFEGWFGSNDDFESQLAADLVSCPLCGNSSIIKLLSAPRLNLGGARASAPSAQSAPPVSDAAAAPGAQGAVTQPSPEARWIQAVREVLSRTEDVGTRFAAEARRMHYGESPERSIRGQATRDEARSLVDEGIPVMTLPIPEALKGTLQ